jgi:hypothetical protein
MNYYLVNGEFYFVDLPGYGYARLPEQIRSSWGKLIEQYLKTRSQLSLVLQLVDARHEPTELDMMMVGWLDYYEIPFLVTLTKADKLPASKMPRIVQTAKETFSRFTNCREVLPFSSISGLGSQRSSKSSLSTSAHSSPEFHVTDFTGPTPYRKIPTPRGAFIITAIRNSGPPSGAQKPSNGFQTREPVLTLTASAPEQWRRVVNLLSAGTLVSP